MRRKIHKEKRMMGWQTGFRCIGRVRGDKGLRVCACACVFSGLHHCWHTAAGKSSLVCLKQDYEICRRAPNARAAVTLNHSHTSNPHAVTQHTHTHKDTHAHTHLHTHPRGLATRCTGPILQAGRQSQCQGPPATGSAFHIRGGTKGAGGGEEGECEVEEKKKENEVSGEWKLRWLRQKKDGF